MKSMYVKSITFQNRLENLSHPELISTPTPKPIPASKLPSTTTIIHDTWKTMTLYWQQDENTI